ncbi:hypothetical protein ACFL24_00670 [Patescibacteria group bacterium]
MGGSQKKKVIKMRGVRRPFTQEEKRRAAAAIEETNRTKPQDSKNAQ